MTRVLLDCRYKQGAGPNVATHYFLDALVEANPGFEFSILQHHEQDFSRHAGIKKLYVSSRRDLLEFVWVQTILPKLIRENGIDICHSLKHVGPLYTGAATLLHVHEVAQFTPGGRDAFELDLPHAFYWGPVLKWGMRRATHVVCTSQHSAREISERIGIDKKKVSVVPYGLDSIFRSDFSPTSIRRFRRKNHLPDEYILCVGEAAPQENYRTVARMMRELKSRVEIPPVLLIVGDRARRNGYIRRIFEELGVADQISIIGFVDHRRLVEIYSAASLLLFPPLAAAFGIPPIEAMACGIPVIASAVGAIPEVTAGAALLIEDPTNELEMVEAVIRALTDQDLRKRLRDLGLERAKLFSWRTAASQLFRIYESIAT